jgi:hypothetical protein
MLNRDYKEMLSLLQKRRVEYIVVGAYGLAAHGFPRSTGDIDIWINPTKANAQNVYGALAEFGAPLENLLPSDLEQPGIVFQIGVAPCRIDILTRISGNIPFQDAYTRKVNVTVGDVVFPVLSREDIIANKTATGRKKDLLDVEELKKRS